MKLPGEQFAYFSDKHNKVVCRKDFVFFEKELLNFPSWFSGGGQVIHADRNVLKRFEAESFEGLNADVVVKAFKEPGIISRVIYSFFRSSKAKRSFENSWRLLSANFSVPMPMAFVECFENKLLKESFYISEYLSFDCTLHQVYRKQMFDWNIVLPLVVEQAFRMHQSGLLHRDFSHGNVLVKKEGDLFSFSFVDLNRLHVGSVSFEQGLKSLVRLANNDESLVLLSKHYARCAKKSEADALRIMNKMVEKHRSRQLLKKNIKKKLGISKK